MVRAFCSLRLTQQACLGLREAIRPLGDIAYSQTVVVDFCRRLYLALHVLEADPDLEAVDFLLSEEEIMVINNFLSAEDGDWAGDVLLQTRQVLFELTTGREAVVLASNAAKQKLFQDLATPGEMVPEKVGD